MAVNVSHFLQISKNINKFTVQGVAFRILVANFSFNLSITRLEQLLVKSRRKRFTKYT